MVKIFSTAAHAQTPAGPHMSIPAAKGSTAMSDPVPQASSNTRSRLVLAVAGILCVAALLALGVYTWQSLGPVEMSSSGYVALVLGVLGTVALGGGLMTLLFYSNRRGYDDEAGGKRED